MTDHKPFVFTRHARNRMRRTRLTQPELLDLVRSKSAEHRDGNRINLWVRWNAGWLRIVLAEEADAIVVVSVIWPAREPREPAS